MAYICLTSAVFSERGCLPVTLEVDLQPGLPEVTLLGVAANQASDQVRRVRSAMKNSGFKFPAARVTANCRPTLIQVSSASLDLSLAVAILILSKQLSPAYAEYGWLGRLSLRGEVEPGLTELPKLLSLERTWIFGQSGKLGVHFLGDVSNLPKPGKEVKRESDLDQAFLLDQLQEIDEAKRVLLIALSGKHHLALTGPPGSGKTSLVQGAGELLPKLSLEQENRVNTLFELASQPKQPIQNPSPTLKREKLFSKGRPGEFALASGGILFFDEWPQFSLPVRESLRFLLEEPERYDSYCQLASLPLVITAQNLCPCGAEGILGLVCTCTAGVRVAYQEAHSQALRERFSLWYEFTASEKLSGSKSAYPGSQLKLRIGKARALQVERNIDALPNGQVPASGFKDFKLNGEAQVFLAKIAKREAISWRSLHNLIRVGRTIADLMEAKEVDVGAIQEAWQYRFRRK